MTYAQLSFLKGWTVQAPSAFRRMLTLPALGGSVVNTGTFVIVVYEPFFVQQTHAVKAENKDRL